MKPEKTATEFYLSHVICHIKILYSFLLFEDVNPILLHIYINNTLQESNVHSVHSYTVDIDYVDTGPHLRLRNRSDGVSAQSTRVRLCVGSVKQIAALDR